MNKGSETEKTITPTFAYLQSVSVFETVGDDFAFGHVQQPVEFSTTVSAAVEISEPLVTFL